MIESKAADTDKPDFTVKTLAEFLQINECHLSQQAAKNRVYGMYRVGNRYRFARSEIMFRRATGQNIFRNQQ